MLPLLNESYALGPRKNCRYALKCLILVCYKHIMHIYFVNQLENLLSTRTCSQMLQKNGIVYM